MNSFNSFAVIDLETTGLDPSKCEIIEVGVVRFVDGEIVEQFSQLVKPRLSIPAEITRLTGISNDAVKDCPDISEVFEKYFKLIQDSPWVIGHNVSFDLSFLKGHLTRQEFGILEGKSLDSSVLARILFPRLARYSLAGLMGSFNVSRKQAHRALDDSLATGKIYLKMLEHLASLPVTTRESIGKLLFGAENINFFRECLGNIRPAHLEPKIQHTIGEISANDESELYPDNVLGDAPPQSSEDYRPVNIAAVENCFLNGGLISRFIQSFEYRPQQAKMATTVAEAFNDSNFLLSEAPTGVGKSLAYLLPASWWASQNRERVVISTQTKSLQSQLFYKDLPQIQMAVEYNFKATLLKGKGNYICLYKYNELLAEAEVTFSRQDRESMAALVHWVRNTRTGDISECHGFNPSQNHYIWNRISCEGSFCLGQSCPQADRCFLLKVRREAMSSQIIITNHHLTFADFASGGELVLNAGNIIFDEAHNLEKIAASYLGNVFDKRNLDKITSELYSSRPSLTGLLPHLKLALLNYAGGTDLVSQVDSSIDAVNSVNYASNNFFGRLNEEIQKLQISNDVREIPYKNDENLCDFEERESILADMEMLLDRLEHLIENLRDEQGLNKRREFIGRLEGLHTDLKDIRETATDVLYAGNPDNVYWLEKPSSIKYMPRLLSAPLEVGKLLSKNFYDHLKTAVFTSATMTVDRKFDYIIQRLGLDLDSRERITTVALDTPFDINSQVAVITAGYLPSPKESNFEDAAIESLRQLLCSQSKKTMVLFTSHRSLKNASDACKEIILKSGLEFFTQESSYSSERIFRRFKAAKKAVLFGTDTFWEGVDLPGELLELLILFKLPFTAPDRPWFRANLQRIEQNGESSFAKLSLPEAVVKFRQGFGRLIRTASDRGCVVILDSRAEKSSFGRVFLNSVGGTKYRCQSPGQIASTINDWMTKPQKTPGQ